MYYFCHQSQARILSTKIPLKSAFFLLYSNNFYILRDWNENRLCQLSDHAMRRNASATRSSHKSSQKKLTRNTDPAFHTHLRTKTPSYPDSLISWKKLYYPYHSGSTKLASKNFPLFQKKKSQNSVFNLWLPQPDRFLSLIHENSLKKDKKTKTWWSSDFIFRYCKKYRSNRSPNLTLPTLSNAIYSKSLRGISRQVSLMEEMAF